jgi:hypothetical protein
MDISQQVPILLAVLIAALAALAFYRSRRLAAKALRLTLLIITATLGGLAALVACALIYFNLNYTRHLPPIVSPDGAHIALITYTVDTGTGIDEAEIALRRAWSPYSYRIYAGPSQYDPEAHTPEPQAQWLDSAHLIVRFRTYVSAANSPNLIPQGCAATAAGITITCEENRVHATH